MAGMGPPPKPGARKPNNGRDNNPFSTSTVLPSGGRTGPAPAWPLALTLPDELAAWADLWATPQAAAWETLGWTRAVARFCRLMLVAEQPDAAAALLAEARQMEAKLGLTPEAMLRLRWSVAPDEVADARGTKPKRRLKVADPSLTGS